MQTVNVKVEADKLSLDDIIDLVKKEFKFYGVKSKFYISGGCVTGTLNDKPYDDIDIYFYNKDDAKNAIEKIKTAIEKNNEPKQPAQPVVPTESKNKMTLDSALGSKLIDTVETKYAFTFHSNNHMFQLISSFAADDPIDLMNTFDLTCCMVSYTSKGKLIKHPEYNNKALIRLKNMSCSTVHRYIKYVMTKEYDFESSNFKLFIDYLIDRHDAEFLTVPGYEAPAKQKGIHLIDTIVHQSYNLTDKCNFELLDYVHESITRLSSNERINCFQNIFLMYTDTMSGLYCDELLVCILDYKINMPEVPNHTIAFPPYETTDKDRKIIMKFPEYFL